MKPQRFILHLGLGAFHRAHQAAYLQRLHDLGDREWQIVSGNIRSTTPDPARQLQTQDYAYTLETISPAGERAYQLIKATARAVPYEPRLAEIIERGADAATGIISFTVTEAGYFLDADDRLDLASADLCADIAAARQGLPGTTIYGALSAILRQRSKIGAGPVTLLCCDNLRHNGSRFRQGLMQFMELTGDLALLDWVRAHTTSPCTMVDRITPRTPPELAARVLRATGRHDAAPVMSESFMQWVLEDDFCNGRPDWVRAGAQLVASVAPYEEAKIRILNATHSCIAWAGALAGHRYIHECMRDRRIHAMAHAYVTEAVFDCLRPSPVDLERYRDQVFQRFASDAIEDTTERVLADGFAKLPGFVLPTLAERLSRGLDVASVALLPALFLQFLRRWYNGDLKLVYSDQAMDSRTVADICRASDPVAAFCSQRALWDDLADSPRILAAMRLASVRVHEFERA
ncbi:MAG: D-arabinitol 4-dehydrogenase [Pseudomonadota bacterium]